MTTPRSEKWGGRRAQALTAAVLDRDARVCAWCGGVATTADHVTAIANGGAMWDLANLVAACRPCNLNRGARARPTRAAPRPSRQW